MSEKEEPRSKISQLTEIFGIDKNGPTMQNPSHMPQNPFRWLVTGASNSGKTYKIVEHILNDELRFDKLYLYCKDPFDSKYIVLANFMAELADSLNVDLNEIFVVGTEGPDIIPAEQLDESKTNLVIFDDFVSAGKKLNETVIANYFVYGRHKNASVIYLSQSFYNVPKIIRLQCTNYSVFKYQNLREINSIYTSACNSMDKDEFLRVYKEATDKPHGCLDVFNQ